MALREKSENISFHIDSKRPPKFYSTPKQILSIVFLRLSLDIFSDEEMRAHKNTLVRMHLHVECHFEFEHQMNHLKTINSVLFGHKNKTPSLLNRKFTLNAQCNKNWTQHIKNYAENKHVATCMTTLQRLCDHYWFTLFLMRYGCLMVGRKFDESKINLSPWFALPKLEFHHHYHLSNISRAVSASRLNESQ